MSYLIRPFRYDRADRSPGRSGFTLVELLIVSLLISAMMAGIWTLLRSWSRISDRGRERTERAQLVRSLCDQFRDDLHAVAFRAPQNGSRPARGRGGSGSRGAGNVDPGRGDVGNGDVGNGDSGSRRTASRRSSSVPASSVPASSVPASSVPASSSASRSSENGEQSLVGGSDWLILDVLQAPNPYLQPVEDQSVESIDSEQPAVRAPELQRVIYSFQADEEDAGDLLDLPATGDEVMMETGEEPYQPVSGLVRLEIARELLAHLDLGSSSDTPASRGSTSMREVVQQIREAVTGQGDMALGSSGGLAGTASSALEDQQSTVMDMIRTDEVPEVRSMEFRYFDGSSWRSSWNSESEQRLPVAVEFRFELKRSETADEFQVGDDDTELVEDERGLDQLGTSSSLPEPDLPVWDDDGSVGVVGQPEVVPYERCLVYLGPAAKK